jgi:hypothetical protein
MKTMPDCELGCYDIGVIEQESGTATSRHRSIDFAGLGVGCGKPTRLLLPRPPDPSPTSWSVKFCPFLLLLNLLALAFLLHIRS